MAPEIQTDTVLDEEFDLDLQLTQEIDEKLAEKPSFTSDICNTGICSDGCPSTTTGPCPC